jgi:hypothetical protein
MARTITVTTWPRNAARSAAAAAHDRAWFAATLSYFPHDHVEFAAEYDVFNA